MKWLGILFAGLTAVIIGIYVLLFTSTGHGVLLPIASEKIQENAQVKSAQFKTFTLSMNQIDIILDLDGELFKVKGSYDLFSKTIDITYDIFIKNLATFKKAAAMSIQGDFKTKGRVRGKFHDMFVKGDATTANGTIDYNLNLKDEDLKDVNFDLKNISLQKLLWMVGQPLYTDAKIFSKGKISSLNKFDGNIVTIVKNGVLNSPVVKKQFNIDLPANAVYDLHVNTELKDKKAISVVDFNTFAANIDTAKSVFDLNSGVFTTDYTLIVPSLAKLYFVTKQKMRGDLKIIGDVKFDKKLLATFNLKEFDGIVNGKLDGDKLSVDAKDIQILKLLHMMYYPEIFKSPVMLDLDYNLVTKKGTSKLQSTNGQFLTNQTMDMLKKLTRYDLTLEVYDTINLDTNINDTFLANNLLMKSTNSQIKSNRLNLDTKKSTIDADIDLEYRGLKVGIGLAGNVADPSVKLDTSDLIKVNIRQEAQKQLDKHLGDKLNQNVGDVLKKLF